MLQMFVFLKQSSTHHFICPPGEETASQHWWECRGGGRVGRRQCWWNGGWLQADERRCMYFLHFPMFISAIYQRQTWHPCVQQMTFELCMYFLFLMAHVKMKQLWLCVLYCLAFVPIVLSQLCASVSFVSVWLFVLISYSSLFLFVPSSSPQLLFASKWKVLYELIAIQSLPVTCCTFSLWQWKLKVLCPKHFSVFHL